MGVLAKKNITAVLEPDDDNGKKKKKSKDEKVEKKPSEADFFNKLMKNAGVDIPVVEERDEAATTTFFDTGSMALNALLSGMIAEGGIAGSNVTALAGEESTGKTFIALQVAGNFLTKYPTGHVYIFDSENDPSKGKEILHERGLDTNRVHVERVKTIQDFRKMALNLVDAYLEFPVNERFPLFIILDSLGNLSTTKEMNDIAKGTVNKQGEEVRDMTRPGLIRGLFRVLTIKLGEAGIPMLITNHTYETMDPYGAKQQMSGGQGTRYAASTIVFLGKKALRDEEDKKEVLGSILTATLNKSRFTRFGKKVELLLSHDMGLDKYWGLFDMGKDSGLLIMGTGDKGNKIKTNYYKFPDGQIASKKEIIANPVKFFDTEINLAAFEDLCARTFRFGKGDGPIVPDEDSIFEIDNDESELIEEDDNSATLDARTDNG